MSLFDYAQRVISRKLENSSTPMLTISMGSSPVMPMAQGGGLSSVQNRLNINGEPHRLAYINSDEESLLKQLGGSGRKINGIPAYDDSVDGGSGQGGNDNDEDDDSVGEDTDMGGYSEGQSVAATQGLDAASIGGTDMGGYTEGQSLAVTQGLDAALGIGSQDADDPTLAVRAPDPYSFTPDPNVFEALFGITPTQTTVDLTKGTATTEGTIGIPGTLGFIGRAVGINPGFSYTDVQSLYGPPEDEEEGLDDGQVGGDEIIRKRIAAVKKVPVEEVTDEEVKRAKRLTAAQRLAGTNLEEILNQIYGSGRGKGLLGIPSSI